MNAARSVAAVILAVAIVAETSASARSQPDERRRDTSVAQSRLEPIPDKLR